MAPTLIGEHYSKDLSKLPLFPGGSFVSRTHCFILPDDTRILRFIETTYEKADYNYIAVVYELAFHSQDFIDGQIDEHRENGLSDQQIVEEIICLDMEDEEYSIVVARFAYDDFNFLDHNAQPATGKQIRGAFVDSEKSGVGLAGQVYRQLVIIYGHLICDNTQTEFGASLWASTIRDVVGKVNIYDYVRQKYIEELGELAIGTGGCTPWDLGTTNQSKLTLSRWKNYPFQIQSCHYLVLIVSA
ncbi:hypothetical protein [Yersinia enterocolitica]|uniref:hypothetical protein n=1 Tax=Yersinia enterocolitica TaxID=630 RepID=UPI0028BB029F|nr:hypothetical protein [Yersinia enterocolitica]ELI8011809.1 hypothetical protein [Yersinia enterocolitica]